MKFGLSFLLLNLSPLLSPATTPILAVHRHKGSILLFILRAYLSDSVLKCADESTGVTFIKQFPDIIQRISVKVEEDEWRELAINRRKLTDADETTIICIF